MIYPFAFIFALAASVLMLPRIITIAEKLEAFDTPNERKVHERLIPRIGGIAIIVSVSVAFIFMQQIESGINGFMLGALIIFLLGFFDDIYGINWQMKFLGQFLAVAIALLIISPEYTAIRLFGWQVDLPPVILYTGIIFFIVGGMNSLNLLDGLDGLASGVSLLVFIGYGFHGLIHNNVTMVLISLAFAGALLGFLRYNSHPAKIFLGDSGSLLLGFAVAITPLLSGDSTDVLPLTLPIIALTVPMIDTLRVSFMRLVHNSNPFLPDKTHLHHRLLTLGMRHDFVVLSIHILTAFFVFLTFFLDYLPALLILSIYLVLVLITLFLPKVLLNLYRFQWIQFKYRNTKGKETFIDLPKLLSFGANPSLLRHSIIAFLFTQFIIIDYQSIPFYPLAFLLVGMVLYFYFNSGTWSDHYVMILVLFSMVYFQITIPIENNLILPEVMKTATLINDVSIVLATIALSCMLITNGRQKNLSIIKPIDYLIIILLFSFFIMPLDTFDIPFEKYHLTKAAVIYLGTKSLFSFSVKGNRRIIYSVLILLLATGIVGAAI